MEVKKTKKADLERKRSMFLQIGFIVALGASLVAFEWKTIRDRPEEIVYDEVIANEEELPPIVRLKDPEPPKAAPKQIILEKLRIVEDDDDLPGDELDFSSESLEDLVTDLTQVEQPDEDGDPIPFYSISDKPQFPGGQSALIKYLANAVRYPVVAAENGIQGTVYLSFVINKVGKVVNVKILRGVDSSIDREALRVVSSMPDWKPGRQGTQAVSVSYQVPIKFALQ